MNILVKNHHNHDLQESVHFLNYTFVHEMQHEVPVLFHLFQTKFQDFLCNVF
jgi:hypothetical protein